MHGPSSIVVATPSAELFDRRDACTDRPCVRERRLAELTRETTAGATEDDRAFEWSLCEAGARDEALRFRRAELAPARPHDRDHRGFLGEKLAS